MKVLVANRGEIAVRIIRACKEMGLKSVAVYSETDQKAMHTRYADEAVSIGATNSADSYGNIRSILEAAQSSGAQAIHPGYGFLSENAAFAQEVEEQGLVFIGPRPETIALTGDKLTARRAARDAGLPILPGVDQAITDVLPVNFADQVQFPVLIKAVSGGGGRGIRMATDLHELEEMVAAARREARNAFGDDTVYLEQLVTRARHIEVQIMGDGNGNIICLGERECSIQRRRQKLIEEAPAPGLSDRMRNKLYDAAIRLASSMNYRSLGTIEFLLDEKGQFHFIEVNPRIQVEHPITEAITGTDLVHAQLRLMLEGKLCYQQDDIQMHGWAIESRVLAEDCENGFLPVTGEISHLKEPGGPGIRVDSALYPGMPVTTDYDSLLAKVIAWGQDRHMAIQRLCRGLAEFQVGGVSTDIQFLLQILTSRSFIEGRADTTYLDTFRPEPAESALEEEYEAALAVAILTHQARARSVAVMPGDGDLWRMTAWREQMKNI